MGSRLTPTALGRTLVLVGVLITAHLYVVDRGPAYAGGLLFLNHVYDLAVTLILFAICIALGRIALRHLGLDIDESIADLAFSTVMGAGIIATLLLFLGSLGGLQKPTIALLLATTAILARGELRGLPRLLGQAIADLRAGDDRLSLFLVVATLGVAAFFLVTLALAPPSDWDSLMYHLQVPSDFLHQGRIYVPEDNLHVSRVGLVHMLYLPLLAAGSQAGPAVLSALLALVLALAVFSASRRLFGLLTGRLSLALFWGSTAIILVAITPRVDVSLTLFLLAAHYALLIALDSPNADRRRYFYCSAVILGFAAGVKYHAIAYGVGLAPLAIWVAFSRGRSRADALIQVLIFAGLVVAAAAPWLAKNWLLLDAPLYPFFSERLLQPWLATLFGTQQLPASFDMRAFQLAWDSRSSFNIKDAFLAPGNLSIESEAVHYFTNPALVLLPLWLLFIKNRRLNALVVPAAIYLLLVLVPFPKTNLRYLIPALVPLTIVVAYVASTVVGRFLPERATRPLLAALVALALIPTGRAAAGRLAGTAALQHLMGPASVERYLWTHELLEVRVWARVLQYINTDLPADARILMLFEARGFYITSDVLQDNKGTNWPLLASLVDPQGCLESTRISHVLLGQGAVDYYADAGVDLEIVRWDEFNSFRDRCLTELWEGRGFVMYEVNQVREGIAP